MLSSVSSTKQQYVTHFETNDNTQYFSQHDTAKNESNSSYEINKRQHSHPVLRPPANSSFNAKNFLKKDKYQRIMALSENTDLYKTPDTDFAHVVFLPETIRYSGYLLALQTRNLPKSFAECIGLIMNYTETQWCGWLKPDSNISSIRLKEFDAVAIAYKIPELYHPDSLIYFCEAEDASAATRLLSAVRDLSALKLQHGALTAHSMLISSNSLLIPPSPCMTRIDEHHEQLIIEPSDLVPFNQNDFLCAAACIFYIGCKKELHHAFFIRNSNDAKICTTFLLVAMQDHQLEDLLQRCITASMRVDQQILSNTFIECVQLGRPRCIQMGDLEVNTDGLTNTFKTVMGIEQSARSFILNCDTPSRESLSSSHSSTTSYSVSSLNFSDDLVSSTSQTSDDELYNATDSETETAPRRSTFKRFRHWLGK